MRKIAETISTAETAAMLGMSVSQINRLAAAGDLPVIAKAPGIRGAYLFDRADVERILAERAA